jgi:hypothetical protein
MQVWKTSDHLNTQNLLLVAKALFRSTGVQTGDVDVSVQKQRFLPRLHESHLITSNQKSDKRWPL